MTGTKKDKKKKEIAIKMIIVLKFNSYINTAKREWKKISKIFYAENLYLALDSFANYFLCMCYVLAVRIACIQMNITGEKQYKEEYNEKFNTNSCFCALC